MIDLHSHILPGIDDGARSLDISLEMARQAVADGTKVMACTPHIYPGLYENDRAGIESAVDALRKVLAEAGIDQSILDPRSTWADGAEYDATAAKLVQLFIDNFAQFEAHVDEGVKNAAPAPIAA